MVTTPREYGAANSTRSSCGKVEAIYGIGDEEIEKALMQKITEIKQEMPSCFITIIKNPIRISFVAQNIEIQEIDVIVNSTKASLKIGGTGIFNRGTVTRAISEAAGPVARQSVRQAYPRGINPGEIAIGDPGELACRKLFHAVIEEYNQSKHAAKIGILKRVVESCLQQAEEMNYRGIAFPVLGVGERRFPLSTVAQTMLDCFLNYAMTQSNTTITDIIVATGKNVEGATGATLLAFQHEQNAREKMLLQERVSKTVLIKDPTWLCHGYLHITAHSEEELDRIVAELSKIGEK